MVDRSAGSGIRWGVLASAAALFLVVGMVVAAIVFHYANRPPEVRDFEFRLLVRAGLVEEAAVGKEEVRGVLRREPTAEDLARYAALAAPYWPDAPETAGRRQVPFPTVASDGTFRAVIPPGEDRAALRALLDENRVRHTGAARPDWIRLAPLGLGIVGLLALLALLLRIDRRTGRAGPGVPGTDPFRPPEPEKPETKLHDVGGLDDAMDAVLELVDFLKMPDRLRRLGAVLPRGVLLVGPRGSGKTLLAQALAGEALVPLFRVPAPELVGATAADALRRVRALFERAEEAAPCVVILEDLEGVSRRGVRQEERGGWEHAGTLHALLAELERFDPRSGVVMLAATSRPDVLDPTLLRPGRFDRVVALERPDRYGREAILRIHAQHVRLGSDVSLADVADRTPGLVGADLAALVNEAALVAARREHAAVMREDLETALGRVVDVVYRAVRVFGPEERELLAAHEAGRAVAAALCEAHPDPARGASLVPRDPILDLPLVRRPIEERRVLDEPALKARLTELVAGRIAETILLGRLTSASREPLARARALARWMAEEIGIRAVDAAGRPGPEAPSAEVEAGRLLLEAEARARNLLLAHRDVLAEAATRLAFRERIGSAELLRLVHGHETPGPAEEDRPE